MTGETRPPLPRLILSRRIDSALTTRREGAILHLHLSGKATALGPAAARAAGARLRADLAAALPPAEGAASAVVSAPEAGKDDRKDQAREPAPDPVRVLLLTIDDWDWALDSNPAATDTGPALRTLCDRLSDGALPVLVALSGTVLGDGMDLALAGQYTIVQAGARLGLAQSGRGLLPSGGAIRRLAMRIGAARAADVLLSRRSIPARRAVGLGLVDAVSVRDPTETALIIARLIASGRQGLPPGAGGRRGLADPAGFLDAVAGLRQGIASQPAARAALSHRLADCIEAALLLPEAQGRLFEADAAREQAASPAAAAQIHLAWAARRATAPPDLPPVIAAAPRAAIRRAAVLGDTTLAADLAGALIGGGIATALIAEDGTALAEGLRRIAVAQDRAVAAGHLRPERREADWARLEAALAPERADGADLVIEAGTALRAADAATRLRLAVAAARRSALVATAMPRELVDLAAALGAGRPVLGLHLAEPVGATRLAEIVLPPGTPPAAALPLFDALRKMGRVPLWPRDGAGFLPERLAAPLAEAVAEGLHDGLPAADLAGMLAEIGWSPGEMLPGAPPPKAGAGTAAGRKLWRQRTIAVLANEGLRLLEAGVVERSEQIDLALVEGLRLPRELGGAMFAADHEGLVPLREILRGLALRHPRRAPRPAWDERIRTARPLTDLTR